MPDTTAVASFRAAEDQYLQTRTALLQVAGNADTVPEHLLDVVGFYREARAELMAAAEEAGLDTTSAGAFVVHYDQAEPSTALDAGAL